MATIDNDKLRCAFDRTQGRCHLCGIQLAWKNRGVHGARGAWHLEHSVPLAKGGTNHGNNLYVACIDCNLTKGTRSSRAVRAENGRTRAPSSAAAVERRKGENRVVGGATLGAAGFALGGPVGGLIGLGLGALVGDAFTDED